jgi:hypothetical protein
MDGWMDVVVWISAIRNWEGGKGVGCGQQMTACLDVSFQPPTSIRKRIFTSPSPLY